MFYSDSLFAAVSPTKPLAIFIHYEPLEDVTVPAGAEVHVFSVEGTP